MARNMPSWVIRDIRESGWRSFGWQWLKRRIAEVVASCLKTVGARSVYIVELHGGEYVLEDVGDKDIDLIVECGDDCGNTSEVEAVTEELVAKLLKKILIVDPYDILNIPNIVEIHVVGESYMAKHIDNSYARPVRII